MKNLEKICMILGFVTALVSMVISLYNGQSWTWQFASMCWILVVYFKNKMIIRYESLIEKINKK